MTPRPLHRFVAFSCAVTMMLAIFSSTLSRAPGAAGPWVAQAAPAAEARV